MSGVAPKLPFPILNQSGEVIPPRSAVLVTGVVTDTDGQFTYSTVTKFNGASGNIMVTGDKSIAIGGMGTAFYDNFLYVSVDPGAADPVAGQEWGPVSGSWVLGSAGSGFVAQGAPLSGSNPKRALFYRKPGGGGSQIVQFTLTSADCVAGTGIAVVDYVICDGATASPGDVIDLVDPLGYLTGNPALLVNHKGMAVRMAETDPYNGDSCVYSIISMDDLGYNCA